MYFAIFLGQVGQLFTRTLVQGLLKDQLEIVKIKSNGKIRYAIQPLEEQLSFDKVSCDLQQPETTGIAPSAFD